MYFEFSRNLALDRLLLHKCDLDFAILHALRFFSEPLLAAAILQLVLSFIAPVLWHQFMLLCHYRMDFNLFQCLLYDSEGLRALCESLGSQELIEVEKQGCWSGLCFGLYNQTPDPLCPLRRVPPDWSLER